MNCNNYVMEFVQNMTVDLGTNTINLQVFWQHRYITVDHHVAQVILTTGFNDFGKGAKLKCW
jgi:hypothetical protein